MMQKAKVPVPRSVIIQTLSKRLYSSLASAIREVVTNSSDADTEELRISFYRVPTQQGDEYHLAFFDDGEGMSFSEENPEESEFANYLTIGGLSRRERTGQDQTCSGRPLIGLMGVGSLAVAPWCDHIVVVTKRKGQKKALHAKVEYRKFFEDWAVQRDKITDQYEFEWELIQVPEEEWDKSWTTIDMVGLRKEVADELAHPLGDHGLGLFNEGYKQFTGLTPRKGRRSFKDYSGLVRFMHELALMIPVAYPLGAPINDPPRRRLAARVKSAAIDVYLQGVKLHRPMWMLGSGLARYDEEDEDPSGEYGVRNIAENLPMGIHVEGYIYWQANQLFFPEITGLQIRVNYVGIGGYDPTWLGYRGSYFQVRDKQISGELSISYSDDLLDALKADREGFDQDSNVYKELQECVSKHLQEVLSTCTKASSKRQKSKKKKPKTKLPDVAPPIHRPIPVSAPESTLEPAGPWAFTVPMNPSESIEIRFEDICSIDIEADNIVTTVDSDHQLFDELPAFTRKQTARMIAAMAAATVTDSNAAPEEMVELSLMHLVNLAKAEEEEGSNE